MGVPVRLSAGSAVSATRASVLMGLPSSFTARVLDTWAPCWSTVTASSWVSPNRLTRSGTVVTFAVEVEASWASSGLISAVCCSVLRACWIPREFPSLNSCTPK